MPNSSATLLFLLLSLTPTISGTVVNQAGRPIAGAEVRIAPIDLRAKKNVREARTDGSGRFHVAGLAAGADYLLRVARSGFAPESFPFSTPPAGPVPDFRLTLRPGRTATGILVDAAGKPAVGLAVALVRTDFFSDPELYQGRSGPGGRFKIRDIPGGSFTLRAKLPGDPFVELSQVEIPAEPGKTDLGRQTLPPQNVVEGQVVDDRGQPLEGVQVWWAGAEADQDLPRDWAAGPAAVTGLDGRFTVRSLDPQRYLYLCRAGFEVLRIPSLLRPSNLSRVVLLPAPPPPPVAKVSGRVVDDQGRPVAGALLRCGSFRAADEVICGTRAASLSPCNAGAEAPPPDPVTDSEGRFSFELTMMKGKVFSSIDVWTAVSGFQVEVRENVRLAAGMTTEVELLLRRGAILTGRILSQEGRPAAGAEVEVLTPSKQSSSWKPLQKKRSISRTVADADGNYRLAGIEPGRGVLMVRHREYGKALRKIDPAPGESRLDVILDGRGTREIRGRVLDSADNPVPGASVRHFCDFDSFPSFSTSGDGLVSDPDFFPSYFTSGDGSFVLEFQARDASGEDCRIWAWKEGYLAAFLDQRLTAESVDGLKLRLERGLAITGRLLGFAPGQSVPVEARRGDQVRQGEVKSDGSYRIDSLDPGEWEVTVRDRPLASSARVVLDAGAGDTVLDLKLAPLHEVRGRVIEADGKPCLWAAIRFLGLPLSDAGAPPSSLYTFSSPRDGAFSIDIPEGTYQVVADVRGRTYTVLAEPVEVDGPIAGLEIRLNPGVVLRGRILGFQPGHGAASLLLPRAGFPRIADVAPDGTYVFSDLGPGDFEVLARLDQGRVKRKATDRVRIESGQPAATLDFDLSLGDLSLSVAFQSGDEPVIASLNLLRPDGTPVIEGPGLYNEDSFRYTSLRPGRYRLRIEDYLHRRRIEREIDLASDQEVVIDLREER